MAVTSTMLLHCPACRLETRKLGHYLCSGCWWKLPQGTRECLHDRTKDVSDAYRELLEHCRDRKPLSQLVLA